MVAIPGQETIQEHQGDVKTSSSSLPPNSGMSSSFKSPSAPAQNTESPHQGPPLQKGSDGLVYSGSASVQKGTVTNQTHVGQARVSSQVQKQDSQGVLNKTTPNAQQAEPIFMTGVGRMADIIAGVGAGVNHNPPTSALPNLDQHPTNQLSIHAGMPLKQPGLIPYRPELESSELDVCADNDNSE